MAIHRDRQTMSTQLYRIAKLAKEEQEKQFDSIAHLLTPEALYEALESLRKDASAGVDGVTYAEYMGSAKENIQKLHDRLKSKQYRAQPLRRIYIPKEGGRQRPISIPSLENKIAQRATVELLNAIYEQDFLECSYGFRKGRSPQDALDEVGRVVCRRPISYVLEADICSYFDAMVRSQLMEMIEQRVRDGSILRLIRKWIHIGIIDEGRLLRTETGTGQGQVISPLLANIYLHYVLDEWFEGVVKPRLRGEAYEVRWADDFILCFQSREDAQKVLRVLPSEALNRKLRGHYQYYGRPTNYRNLWEYYRAVRRIWKKWLNRRTRGKTLKWAGYAQLLRRHPLLRPRITRGWTTRSGLVSHV